MRRLLAMAAVAALAGCIDFDLTGLGDEWAEGFCGGFCGAPTPMVRVTGSVSVGSYLAHDGEATLLLYAPSDTVAPADSIPVYFGGEYARSFGTEPSPEVCAYLARAVSRTGEATALQPLFPTSTDCVPSFASARGPSFQLPEYPPLAEPFAVRGRVMVDGRPARSGEVTLLVARRSPAGYEQLAVTTDDDGLWSLEATDGAQRYAMCRHVWAVVAPTVPGHIDHDTSLGLPAQGTCVSGRRLPDIRIGATRASLGDVFVRLPSGALEPVGEDAAAITLLNPADSSVVGEVFRTLDDGSYHVWFPDMLVDPGCDWLLRAELGDRVQVIPLVPAGTTECHLPYYHAFELVVE